MRPGAAQATLLWSLSSPARAQAEGHEVNGLHVHKWKDEKEEENGEAALCPGSQKGSGRPWHPGFMPCPSQSAGKDTAPSFLGAGNR